MTPAELNALLLAERFGKPTPKAPKRNPISGLALAALLADLNNDTDSEQESA